MRLDVSVLDPPSLQRSKYGHAHGECGMLPTDFLNQEPSFELPLVKDMHGFQRAALESLKPMHGTTTLAFVYAKGVVVAVDSRATQGPYIASQNTDKVLKINKYMLGTMAGGAADCQFWIRNLSRQCRLRELENGRRVTVTGASKLMANILFSYRSSGLSIGSTIVGWDETGPKLFYVDSGGNRIEGMLFSVGSGSTYAYGILDSGYKFDMQQDEATELARQAIYHATFRDAASGGTVSVYHIGPDGWEKVSGDDVGVLHYQYYPPPAAATTPADTGAATAAAMQQAAGSSGGGAEAEMEDAAPPPPAS